MSSTDNDLIPSPYPLPHQGAREQRQPLLSQENSLARLREREGVRGEIPSQAETLSEILRRVASLRHRGKRPVLIFDIDDTLVATAGRHLRILHEYASRHLLDERFAEDARLLKKVGTERLHYAITDTAAAAGVKDETLLKDLRDYWFTRFFENEYLKEDRPLPGAPEFCQEALADGARIVYLTGRDDTMRPGTLASLAEHGFPMPDGQVVTLMLKPAFDTPDGDFKRSAMLRVAQVGEVVGGFENEPAHINLFQDAFPDGIMVLLDTKHSGKPVTPHPTVRRIIDYRRS